MKARETNAGWKKKRKKKKHAVAGEEQIDFEKKMQYNSRSKLMHNSKLWKRI